MFFGGPIVIAQCRAALKRIDQNGFAARQNFQVELYLRGSAAGARRVSEGAGAGLKLHRVAERVLDPDASEAGLQILDHGRGATLQNGVQLIAAAERQPNFGAKGSQASLIGRGHGSGPFSFDGVAD